MRQTPKGASTYRPLFVFFALEVQGLLIGMVGLGLRNGPLAGLGLVVMFAALIYGLIWGLRSLKHD